MSVRRLSLVIAAAGALAAPSTAHAHHWQPGACGLPTALPLTVEFAEVSVSPTIRNEIFAAVRPPLVLATSGKTVTAELRGVGAHAVHWQMNLPRLVGGTTAPAPAEHVAASAERLYQRAVAETGCATPSIGLNELHGAWLPTPWSATNTQYRANVLELLRRLHELGAHPYLMVMTTPAPFTASPEAVEWWRQATQVGDLVLELHFNGRLLAAQGPIAAGRLRREKMRRVVEQFTSLGIPGARLGLLHGFQSGRGFGGREGLPLRDWLRVVKWEVLATKQVHGERWAAGDPLGSDWSWGWGDFPALSKVDRDKHVTACVYLWVRDPTWCDGPGRAGVRGVFFNTSLAEGQILLPPGAQCVVPALGAAISADAVTRVAGLRGERGAVGRKTALAAQLGRLVDKRRANVAQHEVLAAEETLIVQRFGGDRGAYEAALAATNADGKLARYVLGEQLRRRRLIAMFGGLDRYRRWTLAAQRTALATATCTRDELPTPAVVDLERVLPALRLVH